MDFTSYIPGAITQPVFDLPKLCDGVKPGNRSITTSGFARRMGRLLPGANVPTTGAKDAVNQVAWHRQTLRVHKICTDSVSSTWHRL